MQINIEVRPGQTEAIAVYEGETPDQISRAFARKFNLSESLEFALREQILLSMSKQNLFDSQQIPCEDVGSSGDED